MSPMVGVEGATWLGLRATDVFPPVDVATIIMERATNQTSQQILLNQLKFAAARSIRTSTIILAVFNTVAAFATAAGILYDTYTRTKRNNQRYQFSRQGFQFVPSTEVYPLVLSLGIVLQGIVFAYAQSFGLDGLFTRGCAMVAQFMLPAVLLVPLIQVVFAVETTIRGLRKKPFAPRAKWTVVICMTVIGLLALASFLVADFIRPLDFCFASLFWFVAKYAMGLFSLLAALAATLLACALVIFWRLRMSVRIEVTERVNASRMVYYLALATVSTTFMLPFFFCLAFRTSSDEDGMTLTLSMIAAVVANVSGLTTGGVYLFLKSATSSTIGPKHKAEQSQRHKLKHQIRRYGDNDTELGSHAVRAVSRSDSRRQMADNASLDSREKEESPVGGRETPSSTWSSGDNEGPNPLRSNAVYTPERVPQAPQAALVSSVSTGHARKRSYSIFPGNPPVAKSSIAILPSTTYAPRVRNDDTLKPPSSMRNLLGRHKRDSSMISSATVQMVLRLSSAEGITPTSNRTTAVDPDALSVYSQQDDVKDFSHKGPETASIMTTSTETVVSEHDDLSDAMPKRDPVKDARMKTLPPVPNKAANAAKLERDADETLSPTVYSPHSARMVQLPSARGENIAMPAPMGVTGIPRSPPPSSPPSRRTGDTTQRPEQAKAAWI